MDIIKENILVLKIVNNEKASNDSIIGAIKGGLSSSHRFTDEFPECKGAFLLAYNSVADKDKDRLNLLKVVSGDQLVDITDELYEEKKDLVWSVFKD
ncbi:hypothetical protein LCGC14_0405620 [marine sediment metagenome]|uniref:Uncharacterized protein n=1 Tax=marine sediment metagenome TaxID=412755 RepID=A0A0F9W4N3_9ZZZZ|nr:hypothetical protein [archaeon]